MSGGFLRPRPEGSVVGHWGPRPQNLQPVCRSPPYQASQYFDRRSSSQIGVSTFADVVDVDCADANDVNPSFKSGSMIKKRCRRRHLLFILKKFILQSSSFESFDKSLFFSCSEVVRTLLRRSLYSDEI